MICGPPARLASTGGCGGVQELLADEAPDETRGSDEDEPESQRKPGGF